MITIQKIVEEDHSEHDRPPSTSQQTPAVADNDDMDVRIRQRVIYRPCIRLRLSWIRYVLFIRTHIVPLALLVLMLCLCSELCLLRADLQDELETVQTQNVDLKTELEDTLLRIRDLGEKLQGLEGDGPKLIFEDRF